MSKMVKGMFGGQTREQREAQKVQQEQVTFMRENQAQQQAQIEADRRQVEAVAAGQRRARSGGAGFLAFVDERLGKTFGG